jgi:hypothetical protein
MPLQRFIAVLGEPVFARDSSGHRYRESTFEGRDYWVQAVSATDGTVVEYAITSCNTGFNPVIPLRGTGSSVTLQKTPMIDVEHGEGIPTDYFVSGTGGGRSHFYDEDLGGNGSYYKQLAWGFNDACPQGLRELSSYISRGLVKVPFLYGPLNTEGSWVKRFRRTAIVNTFAETSPNVDFADLNRLTFGEGSDPGGFEIGVDRLLTRQTQLEVFLPHLNH